MSYSDGELSKSSGAPVELYRYKGTYQNFYYTSGPRAVTYQAPDDDAPHTYAPIAIKRSAVRSAVVSDDGGELTLELPVSTPLVVIYGFQTSPPALELTIFRGHNAADFVRYWIGPVENIQVTKGTATIRVPSRLAAALSTDLPNVYYQGPCNHTLFDARCGVDIADWSIEASIVALDGKDVTLASIGAFDGQLKGGDLVLTSGERRMIMAQTGNVVTVSYPFAGANIDDVVTCVVGCDLAWKGDCKTRFDNTARFGGFPLIPSTNVFSAGLEPSKNVADNACLPSVFDGWYYRISFRKVWGAMNEDWTGYANDGAYGIGVTLKFNQTITLGGSVLNAGEAIYSLGGNPGDMHFAKIVGDASNNGDFDLFLYFDPSAYPGLILTELSAAWGYFAHQYEPYHSTDPWGEGEYCRYSISGAYWNETSLGTAFKDHSPGSNVFFRDHGPIGPIS